MIDHTKYLTPENIALTTKVIQALDIEAGKFYNNKHGKEVGKKLGKSEAEVHEFTIEQSREIPAQILLSDGHDHRLLLSIYANLLLAIERPDLANICLASREPE